jgi:hypothetical protein
MVQVMSEFRLRSRVAPEALEKMLGKIVTDDEYDTLITGPARVLKPDGKPLAVYLPGALEDALLDSTYDTLHSLKQLQTDNRRLASGSVAVKDGTRERSKLVASGIIGSFDASPRFQYCRLTAWTAKEIEKYGALAPLFQSIAAHFAEHVPDRYAAQMRFVNQTHPDWIIADTPFSTITVNNTYPTGVHTDAGDLDEGFSTLAVIRRGQYSGGRLVFPEYRGAVDMHHGDVLLMDAHEYHGNTALYINDPSCVMCGQPAVWRLPVKTRHMFRTELKPFCQSCQNLDIVKETQDGEGAAVIKAERISVVSYYRTKIAACGSSEEEAAKAAVNAESKSKMGLVDEMALEAAGVRTAGA